MASLTISNTFTAGTEALASEVNQNFTDVRTFVNSQVVHKDGTNLPFTVTPTISSTNANAVSLANHLTNKAYVDSKVGTAFNQDKPVNVAWGFYGSGEDSTQTGSLTTAADIDADLAVTVTVGLADGTRRFRISASVLAEQTSGSGSARLFVYKTILSAESLGYVARLGLDSSSNPIGMLNGFVYSTVSNIAPAVFSLRMNTTSGAVRARGDLAPSRIVVEDMGPV